MTTEKITRGHGLLEKFLGQQRIKQANTLIPARLRSGRILDIGSGTIPFFLLNTEFKEKFGMDPSTSDAVSYKDIALIKTDIEKEARFPFGDNYFDVITMLAVFEHIDPGKLTDVLSEAVRVLKPGGRFILTTPAPWSDKLLRFMAQLQLVSPEEIQEHKGAYSHAAIADYLYKSGLDRSKMNFGYFELYLNIWACADK